MTHPQTLPLGAIELPFGTRVGLNQCLEAVLEQAPQIFIQVMESLGGRGDKPAKGIGMIRPNFPPAIQSVVNALIADKQKVAESFVARLRHYVYLGVGYSVQSAQSMRFDDLKQFEEEDLDENIQVAGALQEITEVTNEVLPALDALMSSLLGWITVQSQINPLRPEVFARALRDCLTEHVTDEAIRGTIIPHAAARLGVLLRKLYHELCQWLRSCGVEEASAAPGLHLAGAVKLQSTAVGGSVARTLLTLGKLRRLLSGELDSEDQQPKEFVHTVPASVDALQDMEQVEALLERLEKRAEHNKGGSQTESNVQAQQARAALTDGRELGKLLGLEVIRLMLDNLIQDQRLLAGVREQLQKIEPLLLQIAQVDSRFFSTKQHAARLFLDGVTHRSLGFSSEREDGYADFIKSVAQSIAMLMRLTQAGEPPQAAFSEVMKRLTGLWARIDARESLRRDEAARALQHAEQRNWIAQNIAQEFRQQTSTLELPRGVLEFVCGPWSHVIAECQLRSTVEDADPKGYHSLVSDLLWSVQLTKATRNRRRLVKLIPNLLSQLREGLALIELPPERVAGFFSMLMRTHELALDESRSVADAAKNTGGTGVTRMPSVMVSEVSISQFDAAQAEASGSQFPSEFWARGPSRLDDHADGSGAVPSSFYDDLPASGATPDLGQREVWLAQSEVSESGFITDPALLSGEGDSSKSRPEPAAQAAHAMFVIPIGSWVEIMLEGVWVRVQLTWVSPMRTLFMFVSRAGKAHSMTKRTMDRLSIQGLIRLVSDGQMVDSALDAVAQTALRNSARSNSKA